MSKVKFNLKKPNSFKETLILLKMYVGERLPVVISTEEKIYPKNWNFEKQRAKGRHTKFKQINTWLDDLEEIAIQEFRNFRKKGIKITNEELKNAILQKIGKSKTNNLFFDYIEKLYNRKTANGLQVRSYISSLKLLKSFNKNLSFEDITISFYYNYISYLFELGYSRNYVGVQIKNIKTFMSDAFNEKPPLHQNLDFKRKDFKKTTAKTFSIALSPFDIHKIATADLPENLIVTRDYFVIACDTGLRFQNWKDAHEGNFKKYDNVNILVIFTPKKDKLIAVPPSERVLKILKKYGGKLPSLKSNKEVNENLKEIGKLAGLTRITQNIIHKKQKEIKNVPLYKLIHTHTARTSFITNLRNKGVQDNDIMKMTGHSSVSSMSAYDKETAIKNAIKIKKNVVINSYFSKSK